MGEDLADRLGRVESATVEFKRVAKDRDAVRRAVCALANDLPGAGGGDLLIGVDDVGRAPGTDVSDGALLQIAQIRDEGRLLERPSLTVERGVFDGVPVIHVHVHASAAPPVRLDGVAWVRPGPLTKRASADDERVLTERRQAASLPFDARPIPGVGISDLDVELLQSTYIAAAVDPEVLEENGRPPTQQLQSLRLLAPGGAATGLGVLLGGWDPTLVLPGAYIQFVRYVGGGRGGGCPRRGGDPRQPHHRDREADPAAAGEQHQTVAGL